MTIFKRETKAAPQALVIDTNAVVFGEDSAEPKTVKARKITIVQWKRLRAAVDMLPELLIGVITAAPGSRAAYVLAALDHALDEIVEVVAVLTGIEAEWIADNTSADELMAYFVKVAQVNNFDALLKNAQSVLTLASKTEAPDQGAA